MDSDLYMLYILKCAEEEDWNVTQGIAKAVIDISQATSGAMNFFLTDGESLWGFRKGNTLYYYYSSESPQYSVIASQPPSGAYDGWIALYDNSLVILTVDNPPLVIYDVTTIPEFPASFIIPLSMIAALLAVIMWKRKTSCGNRVETHKHEISAK